MNHSSPSDTAIAGRSKTDPCPPGLAALFHLPTPVLAFDRNSGRLLLWNQALERLSGYTAKDFPALEDCLKTMFSDYYDPRAELPLLFANLAPNAHKRCLMICRARTGEVLNLEAVVWDSPADANEFSISGEAWLFPKNCRLVQLNTAPPEAMKLNSPLQAPQEQDMALERYQLWLDLALESLNRGMWTMHFSPGQSHYHSLVFTSPNALKMLGYSPEEIADNPLTWDKLTHPDDFPETLRRMREHVFEAKSDHYEAEFRVKTKAGRWQWLLSYGRVTRRDSQGRPLEAMGTHIDIDRIKQAEENLQKSEISFRTLVENMPLGIMLVDKDGNIDYINPKFTTIFGYTKDSIPTLENWLQRAYPDSAQRAEAAEVMLTSAEKSHMNAVTCEGGDNKYVHTHLVELPFERRLLAYEDVTAQIYSEQTLHNREQELREKSQTLEDINTAMRVVLNQKNSVQNELKSTLYISLRDLILPHLDALEATLKTSDQDACLDTVRSGLTHMVALCHTELSLADINLTSRERQLAELIRADMTSKRIAAKLGLSESVVEFHRNNIRKKLGIAQKKVNLKTYLKAMP